MKKSFLLATFSFGAFLVITSLASAQVSSAGVQAGMGTFAELINTFNKTVVKALGTLFMSGAVVAFFYGLARFILGLRGGEPKVIANGKEFMIWALTALFVMFSVYGIVRFFQGFVPGLNQNTITIPEIIYGGGAGAAATNNEASVRKTCPDGVHFYYDSFDYNINCIQSNNQNNPNTGTAVVGTGVVGTGIDGR